MSGKIYFLADGRGSIKVGFSRDVETRVSHLQTGIGSALELLGTTDGDFHGEAFLHHLLSDYRIKLEWFKDCFEVRECIRIVLSEGLPAVGYVPRPNLPGEDEPYTLQRARALVDIILHWYRTDKGETIPKRLAHLALETGIERGTLNTLRYRVAKDIAAHDYANLLEASARVLSGIEKRLERDRKFVERLLERSRHWQAPNPNTAETYKEIEYGRALLRAECERRGISFDEVMEGAQKRLDEAGWGDDNIRARLEQKLKDDFEADMAVLAEDSGDAE